MYRKLREKYTKKKKHSQPPAYISHNLHTSNAYIRRIKYNLIPHIIHIRICVQCVPITSLIKPQKPTKTCNKIYRVASYIVYVYLSTFMGARSVSSTYVYGLKFLQIKNPFPPTPSMNFSTLSVFRVFLICVIFFFLYKLTPYTAIHNT